LCGLSATADLVASVRGPRRNIAIRFVSYGKTRLVALRENKKVVVDL